MYHSLSPKEKFYFCVFKDDIEKSVCFEILVYFHEDKNFNNYLAISIVKSVEIAFYPMHAQFLLFKSTGIGFFSSMYLSSMDIGCNFSIMGSKMKFDDWGKFRREPIICCFRPNTMLYKVYIA